MLTIDEKLGKAKEYKEKGNQMFKEQKFKKAITCYAKVLAYTRGLPGKNLAFLLL